MTGKIFRYTFVMGLLVLLLSAVLFVGLQYSHTKEETSSVLKQEAEYAASGVMLSGESYLDSLGSRDGVTWIDADGKVLYDSESGSDAANQSECPEVADAAKNGEGHSVRKSEIDGKDTMYYALRCSDGTVLRLSRPLSEVWSVLIRVSPVLWVAVLVLVLAGIFSLRAAKQITEPINEIEIDGVDRVKVYPELEPLVGRIREQNLTIGEQID